MEFLSAVSTYGFLQSALLCGLLVSIAAGVIGSYVVTKRLSTLAGSIAHFILGGMGVSRYLQVVCGWSWLSPFIGAIVAAVTAAFLLSFISLRAKQREDTVVGALWAVGMSVGIIFISKTPGYNEDLMGYLFGNILMVSSDQLVLLAVLDIFILVVGVGLYRSFLAISFDEEFCRIRGLSVEVLYTLLLILTALTVVLLTRAVGIILVIGLLTLPASIANHISKQLWHMFLIAAGLSSLFTTTGIVLSYENNLPAGSTIVLAAGIGYLFTLWVKFGFRWLRRTARPHSASPTTG